MNELLFLLASFGVFALLMGLLLAFSRMTRAVFVETVFHPFTASQIEQDEDGQVRIARDGKPVVAAPLVKKNLVEVR